MSLISNSNSLSNNSQAFLPHHGVWKETSTTTILLTVFNGASKTKSGVSVNDLLHIGPNFLQNPVALICAWSRYKIALSADVEKIFRQIGVEQCDQSFQSILWRFDKSEPIKIYRLTTVTYGLACSPFLAIRTLLKLAEDYGKTYPIAAESVRSEMYSDNVLSGAHSIEEALQKKDELIHLFKQGHLNLRKWTSNNVEVLSYLPSNILAADTILLFASETAVPIIGIDWQPNADYFSFHIKHAPSNLPFTKRSVLSRIARIFDPMGWLAPIVVTAKIIMQSLWILKVSWDEELPLDISNSWQTWLQDLHYISLIKIPRWSGYTPQCELMEVHGFADASKFAYGAVVYLRLIQTQEVFVTLQVAKTRVAPLKTLSIPRLELCAALLLARLTHTFIESFPIKIGSIHLWSDSADVLCWLKDHPSRWGVFVANRCSEIHTLLPDAYWHHVRSADNPADVISRGTEPSKLASHNLWWKGPDWLSGNHEPWSKAHDELNFVVNSLNLQPSHTLVASKGTPNSVETTPEIWSLINKYSSLNKLYRLASYCFRFIYKSCSKLQHTSSSSSTVSLFLVLQSLLCHLTSTSEEVSASEIENTRLCLIYLVQTAYFKPEFQQLTRKGKLSTKSTLLLLNPMIQNHLPRVGGRLSHSLLEQDAKHPLILPADCHFTTLIIRDAHYRTLHGGVQLTLATLRRQYWIVKGRSAVKKVIRGCITSTRYAARVPTQLMGELPKARVRPSPPFERAGIDYAGPINVRLTKTRGKSTMKGYIAIFICIATRAVHIELAEDYSSETFIAAFHRFSARRGHCKELYSDQGTNFVGADSQLRQMVDASSSFSFQVVKSLAQEGIFWIFNPPSAPHFGGLWKAAVKSAKHHLRRVVGNQVLTFSELATLLCRIEACLNSRPLTALSDDPSDLAFLSPSHFLIQHSSILVPEEDLSEANVPPEKRWLLISQLTQHFWARWSSDYLTSLQPRRKWRQQHPPITVGDLVLIRSELTPPAKWPQVRVTAIHPEVMASSVWLTSAQPPLHFVVPSPRSFASRLQNDVRSPI